MKAKIFDIIGAARTGDKTINDATNEVIEAMEDFAVEFVQFAIDDQIWVGEPIDEKEAREILKDFKKEK